ncbi:MAG: carotenoid biosynthesis protein [Chloroflexota bacterium]
MTSLTQRWQESPLRFEQNALLGYVLLGAWLLLMVGMPWLQFFFGEAIIPTGVTLAAIFQACAVFYFVQRAWGLASAALTFVLVAVITWGAEAIGHTTGLPFGHYYYTEALQPQIVGVPLLIPVAWFMLLPSAWVMAQLIVGERDTLVKWAAFVGVSAVALTVWDLFLDPQMVAWGFWVWENPSGYFGIPWINYGGWLLVATIVTIAVRPKPLPVMPFALIYATVWFLQMVGQGIIWQQIGPALVGTLAMGGVMVLAWWRNRERTAL